MNEWLANHLVCPRDKRALESTATELTCPDGHRYPVFDGVPVMLLADSDVTHHYIPRTLEQVAGHRLVYEPEQDGAANRDHIDAFVQSEVPYTSGNLYFPVQHKLTRYPIPSTRLPQGHGERLLDIGCNWGRWSIAAANKGYRPVGLDPSLDAVLAARRVARQLGVAADFVVGDARFLPFSDDAFDTVFSYGVFQHFSKPNVRTSLDEIVRVLRPDGTALIQMPNKYGIRQYQQHRRRGFTEGEGFEVRYWTPSELMDTFEKTFGRTTMTTDCYFGLGIQASDADLLPVHYRMVVRASELLRTLSHVVTPLTKVADSVYLSSVNQKTTAR
ncbi:MAG: methyltransferase domain-containing protein [Acidobacteria bacterium]|nr:methyltransferase domain-containing protein [Acidobacteriota bacterium]